MEELGIEGVPRFAATASGKMSLISGLIIVMSLGSAIMTLSSGVFTLYPTILFSAYTPWGPSPPPNATWKGNVSITEDTCDDSDAVLEREEWDLMIPSFYKETVFSLADSRDACMLSPSLPKSELVAGLCNAAIMRGFQRVGPFYCDQRAFLEGWGTLGDHSFVCLDPNFSPEGFPPWGISHDCHFINSISDVIRSQSTAYDLDPLDLDFDPSICNEFFLERDGCLL